MRFTLWPPWLLRGHSLASLLLMVMTTACAVFPKTVAMYEGNRPDFEIAIIDEQRSFSDPWVALLRGVDGVPVGSSRPLVVRVLPGTHTVTLDCATSYDPPRAGSMYQCLTDCFRYARTFLTFDVGAGEHYVIKCVGPRIGEVGVLSVVASPVSGNGPAHDRRLCHLTPNNWWDSTNNCRCEGRECMGASGASSWSGEHPPVLPAE